MMKRFKNVFRNEAGFTLIELLVVIAVLGILAGIAVPRITGARTQAANAAARSTANTIRNAFEMYFASEGSYPSLDASETSLSDLTSVLSGSGIQITLSSEDNFTITAIDNSEDTSDFTVTITHPEGDTTYTITPSGISSS